MLFQSWLRDLRVSRIRRTRRTIPHAALLETCEPRAMLSVTNSFAAGALTVTSNGADAIAVSAASGFVTINGSATTTSAVSVTTLRVNGGSGANSIDLSGVTATDFTNLIYGKNRNLDFRKKFHEYLNQQSIKSTSIFNGAFMDLLTAEMPLILYKFKRILYI